VHELGCAYLMNWDNDNSLVKSQRTATILRDLKNSTAQEKTMATVNVGFAYGYLGRHDEAVRIFESALKDRQAELGQNNYSSFV
jgi:tetratricopeptide (TPR) repeat protein